MSEPTPELLNSISRDKHARARQMSPLQRLLAGPELYESFLGRYAMGLRQQHPDASAEQIQDLLMKRVAELQHKDRPDEHA